MQFLRFSPLFQGLGKNLARFDSILFGSVVVVFAKEKTKRNKRQKF